MEYGSLRSTAGHRGLHAGDTVEVRTRYQEGQWAHGYEVAEVLEAGYRILRRGSQEIIPDIFGMAEVRLDGAVRSLQ
jgi:hypothetical protein